MSIRNLTPELRSLIERYIYENPLVTSNNRLAQLIVSKEKLDYSPTSIRLAIPGIRKSKTVNKSIDLLNDNDDFDIVRSIYEEKPPYYIPKSDNNILILNDVHIPYHDIHALKIALRHGRDKGVNTIILNGDIADFYPLSQYDRNPNHRDLKYELDLVRQFLQQLRQLFPSASIYYKMGNHENRYERYLLNKAPELFNVDEIQLSNLLHLPEYGITYIDSLTTIYCGKLPLLHGHEIKSGGVNIARSNLLKAMTNIATAHNHRTQEFIQNTLDGSVIGSWAIACLAGLRPDYMPVNNWNHGFATADIDQVGNFDFHNHKIVNGVVK